MNYFDTSLVEREIAKLSALTLQIKKKRPRMAHFLQKEYFENEKEFAEDQACSLGETNFDF